MGTGFLKEGSSARRQPVYRFEFHHSRSETNVFFFSIFVAFVEANSPQKAMVAYEKALEWQDLFELAVRNSGLISEEDFQAMAYRVSGMLPVTISA